MTNNNAGYKAAVQLHLAIVRQNRVAQEQDERRNVRWAFMYGWTVEEIAIELGLTVPAVRRHLLDR